MICDRGDIVIVPFPFADVAAEKRRPSVVLSRHTFNAANGHSICAMITTASRTTWSNDVTIVDIEAAGLLRSCFVRFKLFTLPNAIILRRAGSLGETDSTKVFAAAQNILS